MTQLDIFEGTESVHSSAGAPTVKRISHLTARNFLLPRHYSGRIPAISYAFGLYDPNLVAVITFGKPASSTLCTGVSGVCGASFSKNVFELNRLCRLDEYGGQLSWFVAKSLRELSKLNLIIVSYSDTQMNHHGYIYQATNFIYTGVTSGRTDKYTEGNKHSRHYTNSHSSIRKYRFPKHRYVYFAMNDRRLKKLARASLNYPVLPYPKGDNTKYTLGDFVEPVLVEAEKIMSRQETEDNTRRGSQKNFSGTM